MFEQILQGIAMALTWQGLAMIAVGVFVGITVGAIPGLTSVMATAILVPFSFFMPPVLGIPFLLGIHKGTLFGGSIPAILVNTPGTAPAAATCLDGFPLAQKGEARSAIQMALFSSTMGIPSAISSSSWRRFRWPRWRSCSGRPSFSGSCSWGWPSSPA